MRGILAETAFRFIKKKARGEKPRTREKIANLFGNRSFRTGLFCYEKSPDTACVIPTTNCEPATNVPTDEPSDERKNTSSTRRSLFL
ncbi:hypothetical protein TRSA_02870 [Treponema saccharophilum]|nr:hypothetical protein TRSA_02870 [Treponema saccharophilum]